MKPAVPIADQAPTAPGTGTTQWETYAVWAMALTVILSAVVWAFFCDHPQAFDDIGLFNAPYMYAHYGVLTYPAHGEFHSLFVHPPIHYWIIGLLMKWGIPPFYAEAIPLFLILLLGVTLVLYSEFPDFVKAGLLLGFCTPFLFGAFIPTMRPDIHRGLALFTGLVALESGRLHNWDLRQLFLGSFLVTYASVLHYPGFPGFLGVLVYIAWILISTGRNNWMRPITALVSGGCLIGIPYLVFFFIPHRHEILGAVSSVEPFGGISSSVRIHLQVYQHWFGYSQFRNVLSSRSPITFLFFPVALGIPLILLGASALFPIPATRGIACACLPYPLCLLLLMTHKAYWGGYFLPEFMLYAAGVGVLIALGLDYVCKRLFKNGQSSALAWGFLSIIGMLALVSSSPILRGASFTLRERVHESEFARAAGRAILGRNALVGTRNAIMFYASGAAYYYDVAPDVLWTPTVPSDLSGYFKVFDAVVEHQAFSSSTQNPEHKSLVSWYADGTLKLHGFYLSSGESALPYLLLNTNRSERVVGFAFLKTDQIVRLQEQDDGEYAFVTAVCRQESGPTVKSLLANTYLMPIEADGLPQEKLATWLMKKEEYAASRLTISSSCRVRDEVPLKMEQIDTRQFLATLRDDRPIRFFEHFDEAVQARYGRPSVEFQWTPQGWIDGASFRHGEHDGEDYSFSPDGGEALFRSDMDSSAGLQINRYGRSGGLKILPDGLTKGDHSGQYSSGDSRDHLSSPFFEEPLQAGLLFFSLWAKPLEKSSLPEFYLQNAKYVTLAHAFPAMTRSDGWVLIAGWAEAPRQEKIRFVVMEQPKATTLLDKVFVVESPRQPVPHASEQNPAPRALQNR